MSLNNNVDGEHFIRFCDKNAVFKLSGLVWTEGLSGEKVAFSNLLDLVSVDVALGSYQLHT